MADDTELIWDHAADVQFESSDMSRGVKHGHSTFYGADSVHLSCEQAHELISVLESTREIILNYIDNVEESQPHIARTSQGCNGSHCPPCLRTLKQKVFPKISKNITVVTIVLQALNLVILTLIDFWPKKDDQTVLIASATSMILLQVLNLIALVYTSVFLAKLLTRRRVTAFVLAQNYISSLFLFAGLYTLTYRLQPSSWKFIQEDLNSDPVLVAVLYAKFLFFSVSTATLCGSDNALPKDWYNCLFAAAQMLLSFVYFASILSQSMTPKLADIIRNTESLPGPRSSPRPRSSLSGRRNHGSFGSRESVDRQYSINDNHVVNVDDEMIT
ncbi:uncharacterized protein LOC124149593 isoform X1 [Haliotis rufescens]|uniref:uncharacterized protein LOC124149593 isoform X1 n=1 Tax=Haliotis rufescens TaxID=6454 RepID=UPI001EB07FFA|nr:uncharacterized protein LOC124149593 isoform X1 [Haliotis rufescens]